MKKKLTIGKAIQKVLSLGVLTVLLTVSLAGCGGTDESSTDKSASGKETENSGSYTPVRIAAPGVDQEGNAYLQEVSLIVQEEGYLEEELNAVGYTAEYYGFATAGVGVNEALAANEIDVAIYGDFPALTYLAGGNKGKIIAFNSNRIQLGVFVQNDIKSVKDLKGKKIGTTIGTVAYQYLVRLLEKNGLTVDDVEIVNAAQDAVSLFSSKEIDAVAQSTQMFYSLEAAGVDGYVLASNGNDEELASDHVVLVREEFLEENPEVEQAIVNALEKAQKFAAENPQKVYEIMAEKTGGAFDAAVYEDIYSFDTSFDFWDPAITDDKKALVKESKEFMLKNGYIQKEVDVDSVFSK